MSEKINVIKTISYDDSIKDRTIKTTMVGGTAHISVAEASPAVRASRGLSVNDTLPSTDGPGEIKILIFDKNAKERKEEKLAEVGKLQVIQVVETAPLARVSDGLTSDRSDHDESNKVAIKVVNYGKDVKARTVKQSVVDGIDFLIVSEQAPSTNPNT